MSVSGWVRQAVFRRNFRFVLPHIKAGETPPPFFPSERKGTKKAVFLVFFLKKESKIKKKVEVVAEFVYATANKKGQDRPVFCLRKTLYPKPLNFFLKKLISLSPIKGNRAFNLNK